MEYHAIEAGVQGDLFQIPYKDMKDCLTNTWISNTIKFVHDNDIELTSPLQQLTKWTTDDTFLMEEAMNMGYKGKTLAAINRCRMHINVVTLSDIIDRRTSAIKLQAYEVKFQKRLIAKW